MRYFLICLAAAQLVAFWTEGIDGLAAGLVGESGTTEGSRLIRSYFVLMSAGALPVVIVAMRTFLGEKRFNFAEHTVFHLYTAAHCALLFAISLSMAFFLPEVLGVSFLTLAFLAIPVHYIVAAVVVFSVSKVRATFAVVLAMLLGIGVFSFFLVFLTSSLRAL